MQEETLNEIETILKEKHNLKGEALQSLLIKFKLYKEGKWIYPEALRRGNYLFNLEKIAEILKSLQKASIIKKYYEGVCPNCHHSTGDVFEEEEEIPGDLICDNCNNYYYKITQIYKVIKG